MSTDAQDEEQALRYAALRTASAVLKSRMDAARELAQRTSELEAAVAQMQATLEAASEGILVVSQDGRLTVANGRFEWLWGLPTPPAGTPLVDLHATLSSQLAPDDVAGRSRLLESRVDRSSPILRLACGRILQQGSRPQLIRGQPAGWVWTFLDVTDAHLSEAALREEARALALMNQLEREILRQTDPTVVVDMIVQACLRLGGAEFAGYLSAEAGGVCRLAAYAGPILPGWENGAVVPVTRLLEATLVRRHAVCMNHILVARDPSDGDLPVRSYLAVPVVGPAGGAGGALVLGHRTPGQFTDRIQRLVKGLAVVTAMALGKARMLDEARQLAKERLLALEGEQQARATLEELNATLEKRVAQRTEALFLVNRDLEAFAFSVSHDLRSPLGRVDGFARALQDSMPDATSRQRHFLGRIQTNVASMSRMIEASLELARLSFVPMRRERVDLSAIASRLCQDLAEAEPQRACEVEIEPGLAADGDAVLLEVLLGNLLRNAWKFTATQPQARIRFRRVATLPGKQVFEVADNGVGFDTSNRQRLFVPFQRFHADDEFPGTGIGLATVRRLVERHGGQVRLESAPGQGCRVEFSLAGEEGS